RPRTVNPASWRWARMLPARPEATASGLMMARVRFMDALESGYGIGNNVRMVSEGTEGAEHRLTGEEAHKLPLPHHGNLRHVPIPHQVGGLQQALIFGYTHHGSGHYIPSGHACCTAPPFFRLPADTAWKKMAQGVVGREHAQDLVLLTHHGHRRQS